MANLLFLAHRLPYPPDKGDKVRSYHLLRHLAARHRVHVGTFVDDAAELEHLPAFAALCAGVHAVRLHPRRARVASLAALVRGEALTLAYYRDAGLARWVDSTCREQSIDAAFVFSSSMAPYLQHGTVPVLLDFVDVDSAKWAQYAAARRGPSAWLYRREGGRLLAFERAACRRAARSFFVTEQEAALFARLAPDCAATIDVLGNGVDAARFAPDPARKAPFATSAPVLVFTGAMDYWPNVDAVCWFARAMLPRLRERFPALTLQIVGRHPAPAVRELASAAVVVTGTGEQQRLAGQHASVVVAPLRLARGVQNKVLEAMAMGRPVVAARPCVAAIGALDGAELLGADTVAEHVEAIAGLLADPARAAAIGAAARLRVLASHGWEAQLAPLDRHLERVLAGEAGAVPASTACWA
jgi:sugar transferase (PEP-CTERM/EpsH1 system associated)